MHQPAAWTAKRILKGPCDYEAKAKRNWVARATFWHFVVVAAMTLHGAHGMEDTRLSMNHVPDYTTGGRSRGMHE